MTEETEATAAAPLLGLGTWTQQGPATLVVREGGWAVLVPGTRKEVIEAAWTVLGEAPAAADLLDTLVQEAGLEGADELAAILFAVVDGTTATIGVKGKTPLAVYTAEGSQQVAGTDEEPFVLTTLEGVRRIAFGDLPAEEPLGAPRVSSGIARVRGFVQMMIDPAELDEEARAALAVQVETDGRSIEDPEAAKRRANRPAPAPRPSPGASPSTTASARTPKLADRKPGEMPPSRSGGGSSRSAAPAPDSDGPNMFDGLFAESKPAAPAAAPAPTPLPGPASAPPPAAPAPAPEPSTPAPAPAPEPSTPAPAPAPEPSTPATAAAPTTSEPPRRRLVSTSLFDRKRPDQKPAKEPAAPSATPPGDPVHSPAEQPAPGVAPAPAAPTPSSAITTPAAPTPSSAITTPAAPEGDEEVVSSDTQVAPLEEPADPAPEVDEGPRAPVTQIAPIDDGEQEGAEEPVATPRRAGPSAGSSPAEPESAGAYDDLFGKTVFRRIEDAAVRPGEDDDPAEDDVPSSSTAEIAAPPVLEPQETEADDGAAAAPAEPTPAATGGDFIDWVPGVGRKAPEIAQTAARRAAEPQRPAPAYPQVHMADRPAAPQPESPGAPAQAGPKASDQPAAGVVTLSGLVCPQGHANSPERSTCRACGGPLQGTPRTVARPPLGAIELSTGDRFVLDRSAIVGRRPRASRVSVHDVPQLITVPSPQQDISRSHLELRLEGWHVVALDLGTTNGTTLYREGADPLRLRPREGVVLHEGDVLDLGDGVHLRMRERA